MRARNIPPSLNEVPRIEQSDQTSFVVVGENTRHAGMRLIYEREQQGGDVREYNLLIPGFFGLHCGYVNWRHEAAQLDPGIGAISMYSPRRSNLVHSLAPGSYLHPSLMLSKAVWGVMKDVENKTGVSKFNLIGHSMGGPAAVNAATYISNYKDADSINSVVLNASAGVTNHNLLQLWPRTVGMLNDEVFKNRHELQRRVGGEDRGIAAREFLRYLLHKQTLLEMVAVANCNILDKVADLTDRGIPTAGLYFPADPLFDVDKAAKNLDGRVNIFSVMDEPRTAGHVAPQLFPAEVAAANYAIRQAFFS